MTTETKINTYTLADAEREFDAQMGRGLFYNAWSCFTGLFTMAFIFIRVGGSASTKLVKDSLG